MKQYVLSTHHWSYNCQFEIKYNQSLFRVVVHLRIIVNPAYILFLEDLEHGPWYRDLLRAVRSQKTLPLRPYSALYCEQTPGKYQCVGTRCFYTLHTFLCDQ